MFLGEVDKRNYSIEHFFFVYNHNHSHAFRCYKSADMLDFRQIRYSQFNNKNNEFWYSYMNITIISLSQNEQFF